MDFIDAKLTPKMPSDLLVRPRINHWLKKSIELNHSILLGGSPGMGKTTEACRLAMENYGNRYGYLCLDSHDNDPLLFQPYFHKMVCNAGICFSPQDSLTEGFGLHLYFSQLISALEQSRGSGYMLILDGIHHLTNPDILNEIALFINYRPKNCIIFLICDYNIPYEIQNLIHSGSLHNLLSATLTVRPDELNEYFHRRNLLFGREFSESLALATGGWPGAIAACMNFHSEHGIPPAQIGSFYNPALNQFLTLQVWEHCTDSQRDILKYGSVFPLLDLGFCNSVLGIHAAANDLLLLETNGLLQYDFLTGCYSLISMVRSYVQYNNPGMDDSISDFSFRQAADWYAKNNFLNEAIFCFRKLADTGPLRQFLADHVAQLSSHPTQQLSSCLKQLPETDSIPEICFLRAIAATKEGNFEQAEAQICRIKECSKSPAQKAELVVNLLFIHPEISLDDWFSQARALTKAGGAVHLFSITGNAPCILCGNRDLSGMYCGTRKEENAYRAQWKAITEPDQWACFELAKIEYLILTGQEKQAAQEMQFLYPTISQNADQNILFGLYGIFYALLRFGYEDNSFHETIQHLSLQLRRFMNPDIQQNAAICKVYSDAIKNKKIPFMNWLNDKISHAPTDVSAYSLLLEGHCFFLLSQYERSIAMFEKAAIRYEKMNLTCRLAECLFGQASSEYAVGWKTQALRTATQALTLGARFRYVSIYTQFGDAGTALIEAYQNFICNKSPEKLVTKKKYFYGNIQNASFEEYQDILLRRAQKEAKKMPAAQSVAETLTETETMILRHIGNSKSNAQIGEEMHIKVTTVKTHIYSIYRKLGVSNRVGAVNRGKETGIL